jgi:hypothetical protein
VFLFESVMFSHCDFQAFEGAEPCASLFKTIEVDERVGRFTPYILDDFQMLIGGNRAFPNGAFSQDAIAPIVSLTLLCLRM